MITTRTRIASVAPTASVNWQRQDWTDLIWERAPFAEGVTAFRVIDISSSLVAATLTYGRHGSLKLLFWRYRESADDDTVGHTLEVTPARREMQLVHSEHHTERVGWEEGKEIREEIPYRVRLGALDLNGDRLLDFMLAVHDRLVPNELIAH